MTDTDPLTALRDGATLDEAALLAIYQTLSRLSADVDMLRGQVQRALRRRAAAVLDNSLRARRERLGLTQQEVVRHAHISRGLLADLESGRRRSPESVAHVGRVLTTLEAQRKAVYAIKGFIR